MIPDQSERETALDPQQSFIVQAPAGSGKTEILIQRFLALLAQAQHAPEEIVAITFTRKSAGDMKKRVIAALKSAVLDAPSCAHERRTWDLAQKAYQRNVALKWELFGNPNRLRIQTIDSFCAGIARQSPLLSGLGVFSYLDALEQKAYYLEATAKLFGKLGDRSPVGRALADLLAHLDNRVWQFEALCVDMLERRDLWLPHLMGQRAMCPDESRAQLEQGLRHITEEALYQCCQCLPECVKKELMVLLGYAADQLKLPLHQKPRGLSFALENRPTYLLMARVFLTKAGKWRKQCNQSVGFPAAPKKTDPAQWMKNRAGAMLAALQQKAPILSEHLYALLCAPPLAYSTGQWACLKSLVMLLPALVAELMLIFRMRGKCDHSQVTLSALDALGDGASPTQIDYRLHTQIHHLLVDEFQDTSAIQFRLLEKLTAHWEPGDGRTLFLVGDPMQSIYRFREAKVGLFLKAKQSGIGQVALKPLILRTNFRATPTLVNWINQNIGPLFPQESDISTGAICFETATAGRQDMPGTGVYLQLTPNAVHADPTRALIDQVLQAQKQDRKAHIAILVRARKHLQHIIPALKKAKIPFASVEIEKLHEKPIVQDLCALTCALLHVGDRLAWLSFLRGPICALSLKDLHTLVHTDRKQSIWENMQTLAAADFVPLSDAGKKRMQLIVPILEHALYNRLRQALRSWVETLWRALGGHLCITDVVEADSARAYFDVLSELETSSKTWPSGQDLKQLLEQRYMNTQADASAPVTLMTLHRAKGLEFDTVILPCLEAGSAADKNALLLWADNTRVRGENDLILAPMKPKSQSADDPIYQWIKQLEKQKNQHECLRLLYVGLTRAKKKIYLMAHRDAARTTANKQGTFLALLAPCFQPLWSKQNSTILAHTENTRAPTVQSSLKRLPLALLASHIGPQKWQTKGADDLKIGTRSNKTVSECFDTTAECASWDPKRRLDRRVLGIIIHRVLYHISQVGLVNWQAKDKTSQNRYFLYVLGQSPVVPTDFAAYLQHISAALHRTLQDSCGCWILSAHTEQASELVLNYREQGTIRQCVVDRTFIANHIRWIVDYKVADTQKPCESLEKARQYYGVQLEKYAQILHHLDQRPIHLIVYFPMQGCSYGWAWEV